MQKIQSKLTVFFKAPFWIGIYERESDGQLEACKITFGTEPKDYEVYAFLLKNWSRLQFGPPIESSHKQGIVINPKRMQRAIKKELNTPGVGTKAQQAIKLNQAEGKKERKKKSRLEREEEKERRFIQKQEKKKAKHKGH